MDLAEFRTIKAACTEQGVSGIAYCRQNDIPYHRWSYWNRKLKDAEPASGKSGSFLRVLTQGKAQPDCHTALVESPSGWRVHVNMDLAEILAAIP